jgi:polyhydroxybutyrate depolymerase
MTRREPLIPARDASAAPTPAATRRFALGAVLLFVLLPGVVAFGEGAWFYANNRSSGFITVDGVKRGYVLHVPRGLDTSTPVPVVISLHGGGLWGAAQRDVSRWNDVADREGFIVAYPSGAGRASPRAWKVGGPGARREVEFIARLIDTLVTRYGADPARVHVNGFSIGGGMTFALTCAIPDRIASAGIVVGTLPLPWELCAGAPPLPVMVIQSTDDPIVPYHGGRSWVAPFRFPDIPGWVGRWAMRNGCDAEPRDSVVMQHVVQRSYSGCERGADVRLITLSGDGHVWPGGDELPRWLSGTDSRRVNATEALWEFARDRRAVAH